MERRTFLGLAGATAFHVFVSGGRLRLSSPALAGTTAGQFGPLKDSGSGLLRLPEGFSYRVIQRCMDPLSDGNKMPFQPDGMGCFQDKKGNYILLRNHELGGMAFVTRYGIKTSFYANGTVPKPCFSPTHFGGVSRAVVNKATLFQELQSGSGDSSKALQSSNMVLTGTDTNCAGGVVEGGWVSCEESSSAGHGYAFYTRPEDAGVTAPRPIKSWGRLHREAVAVDPRTGVAYMTEDRPDGCLYRHVPNDPKQPMGAGKLEAMVVAGQPTMDPYPHTEAMFGGAPPLFDPKKPLAVSWVEIPDPQAFKQACRQQAIAQGATRFMRNEGIVWDTESCWFTSSLGGPVKGGQIFEYVPNIKDSSKGELRVQLEVTDRRVLSCPDNLTMAPWGDVVLAEDNYETGPGVMHQFLRGMTKDGKVYDIARNNNGAPRVGARPGGEFTGACFSPDGEVLFVNLMYPESMTVAIRGPWKRS